MLMHTEEYTAKLLRESPDKKRGTDAWFGPASPSSFTDRVPLEDALQGATRSFFFF